MYTKLHHSIPGREWGAAILLALNKNHHIAILVIKLIKLLLIKRFRVPKAKEIAEIIGKHTRPEEHKLHAIAAIKKIEQQIIFL